MRIETISVCGLTTYDSSGIKLPPRGIVLITGPNGAGKSTFIEAVAMAGWGESLRGKPPWNAPDSTATIMIQTYSGLRIERSRTKTKTKLTFNDNNVAPVKYENNTKAQAALDERIGTFDIWKRTSVFSSQDAAHFSTATDGERKRLIESILGHQRFDPAGEQCRKDLSQARKLVENVRWDLQILNSTLQGNLGRLSDAQERLKSMATTDNVTELEGQLAQHNREHRLKKVAHTEEGAKREELYSKRSSFAQQLLQLDQQEERLTKSHCATCTQPINEQFAKDTLEKGKQERARLTSEFDKNETLIEIQTRERERLAKEMDDISQKRAEVQARLSIAKEQEVARAEVVDAEKKLQLAVDTSHEDIADANVTLDMATDEVAELEVAEKVLGLNGVRAHLLHNALGGIEEIANTWLKRLTGKDLELVLSPYSEKATGGIKDAISLEVKGAGGGYGYRAASGGERRRLDIALLLALGEVAEAAHGSADGTLWFDEVFDALDEDGVDAVCGVLGDLAQSRCVVLISHNEHIKSRLKNLAYGIHVEGGKVYER